MSYPLPSPPRAVVFDFAGTIFDDTGVLTPRRLSGHARSRGVEIDEDAAADVIARTLSYIDSPARLAEKQGSDLSAEAHRRVWSGLIADAQAGDHRLVGALYDCLVDNDAWHPYPDTAPVLDALRDGGVKVGILSNIGWDIRPAIARVTDPSALDALVLSCEVGFEKPDPAVFGVACDQLGVPASQVLYVGDDPVKDGAATRAGFSVYLLPTDRDGARPRGLGAVLRLAGVAPDAPRPAPTGDR